MRPPLPELMHRDADTGRFLNALDNLGAERDLLLVIAGFSRKQPIGVATPQQDGPEVVHILVDDRRDDLIKPELERLIVLDVVFGKLKPVFGLRTPGLLRFSPRRMATRLPSRMGATLSIATATAIWAKTAADRSMSPLQASLPHELWGNSAPDPFGQDQRMSSRFF
jgi:hypothetical protein